MLCTSSGTRQVIARPLAQVFAFVADHRNLPAWTVGVKNAERLTAGPPASGSRYRIEGKMIGRTIESSYQVTAFEPGRGFEGTMTSPIKDPSCIGPSLRSGHTLEPHRRCWTRPGTARPAVPATGSSWCADTRRAGLRRRPDRRAMRCRPGAPRNPGAGPRSARSGST